MKDIFASLFEKHFAKSLETCSELGSSGSHRRYFRLKGEGCSAIGVAGTSAAENRAFIEIASHFKSHGIAVPEVFGYSDDMMIYIQEDLGSDSLYDTVAEGRKSGCYSGAEEEMLCKTISRLPYIQLKGSEGLDFKQCYPGGSFDRRMVNFDLNYFKYCFLKTCGIEFDEERLQDDFDKLTDDLLEEDIPYAFMYRDFQARNVMIRDNEPYFIDFQGGRKGPVYYDVASFVWQAKAAYPETLRSRLIETYLSALKKFQPEIDEAMFMSKLRLFVLFRTMQVLGAYGFRGKYERKEHFLSSIPYAIDNLKSLLHKPFGNYPYLCEVLEKMIETQKGYEDEHSTKTDPIELKSTSVNFKLNHPEITEQKGRPALEVDIYSFSYKKGIPEDPSGNGGGYVFDCRAVHNPGKYEFYRQFTGMDAEVIDFLEKDGEILKFLESVYALADAHVERFIERGFIHLQFAFGCTGGQHRSVYSAEHLAAHLNEKYGIKIHLVHREQGVSKVLSVR